MQALAALRTADAIRLGIMLSIGIFYLLATLRSYKNSCVGCVVFPISGCMGLFTYGFIGLFSSVATAIFGGSFLFVFLTLLMWPVVWRILFYRNWSSTP